MSILELAPRVDWLHIFREAPEQHLLLSQVSWEAYRTIGAALPDHPGLRMTYDRGNLEFMTTSTPHERMKKLFASLLETLAEELNLSLETAGNMTFQAEHLAKGIEPDDCFWIAHAASMRELKQWDADRDPPPDLVLEIEASRSALNRLGIYAALGVVEVWRFNGEQLTVHLLQPDGRYQVIERSSSFPSIVPVEIVPFLQQLGTAEYLEIIRSFRAWVREQSKGV